MFAVDSLLQGKGAVRAALIYATLAFCGCGSNAQATQGEGQSLVPPCFVRHEDSARRTLVFVHGIGGDGIETWTNSNGSFWPRLICEDKMFANTNVFVHEYSTGIGRRQGMNINELAENMRTALDGANLQQSKLIFVCHSMGGLVTCQLLTKYDRFASNTEMIFFYGTPATGSNVAGIGRLYRNPQLDDMMRQVNGQNYLANLFRDWRAKQFVMPCHVAYETEGYPVIGRVVDFDSSVPYANQPLDPIPYNHIDMVKPASVNDDRYKVFANAFKRHFVIPSIGDLRRRAYVPIDTCWQKVLATGETPESLKSPRTITGPVKLTVANNSSHRLRLSVLDVAAVAREKTGDMDADEFDLPWKSLYFDPYDPNDRATKTDTLDFRRPSRWLCIYLSVVKESGEIVGDYLTFFDKIPEKGVIEGILVVPEDASEQQPVSFISNPMNGGVE